MTCARCTLRYLLKYARQQHVPVRVRGGEGTVTLVEVTVQDAGKPAEDIMIYYAAPVPKDCLCGQNEQP